LESKRRQVLQGCSGLYCPILFGTVAEEAYMSIFPTKILLATDSSEEATLAARTAVDLADKTSSELHVVLVGLSAAYVGVGPPEIADIPGPRQEELNEEARRILSAQLRQIEAEGGTVAQAHFRTGKPDQEIVKLGKEIGAGLIVMGSRGLGGIRRALMGSVSDSVLRHAHCPVLVVRKEKPAEEAGPEEVGLV